MLAVRCVMNKVCPGCDKERDVENDFRWRYKNRRIRQTWCKYCQAEANKKHYQNNKQIYVERAITRNHRVIAENQRKLYAYLSEHPCVDCGLADIRCLEFDHVRSKKLSNIAELLNSPLPWVTIENEITKCDVRCANCHRIKTHKRSKDWRFLRSSGE